MLRVGVQVLCVGERRGSPDGKLGGVEAITKVPADVGAGGDVLSEVGGRLTDNLLPEVVGVGDVVSEEIEKHTAALLSDHAVLQGIYAGRSGVGGAEAVRGDVGRVDDTTQATEDLLSSSSLVYTSLSQSLPVSKISRGSFAPKAHKGYVVVENYDQ